MTSSHPPRHCCLRQRKHNSGISCPYQIAAWYSTTVMWGRKRVGAFLVKHLNVITSSSRNNNLYPDCISTLEVGVRWHKVEVEEKEWRQSEGERICIHLTFSHWLNYLVSNSHLEFHGVPTETVIIPQSAAGKQRSQGIFSWWKVIDSYPRPPYLLVDAYLCNLILGNTPLA